LCSVRREITSVIKLKNATRRTRHVKERQTAPTGHTKSAGVKPVRLSDTGGKGNALVAIRRLQSPRTWMPRLTASRREVSNTVGAEAGARHSQRNGKEGEGDPGHERTSVDRYPLTSTRWGDETPPGPECDPGRQPAGPSSNESDHRDGGELGPEILPSSRANPNWPSKTRKHPNLDSTHRGDDPVPTGAGYRHGRKMKEEISGGGREKLLGHIMGNRQMQEKNDTRVAGIC